ncbi:hypothetical protein NS115_03900 [Paenibacillus jamilae]|uniref:Uncharacterized protein n=1 Tax=Paenibacillus jamilae TaxID=114136 RepID=A0ACC4ZZL1_9BACL|nr:HK97 gp10 family phage protein [Paenibacillus jamilae]KTS84479.1 hypothetical protein NS115_03900 [Paenibacillus jamilae]
MARREVEINLDKFLNALQALGHDIGEVVKTNVKDILDDWQRQAVDLAPIDTSTLRRSIHGKVIKRGTGLVDVTGEMRASAIERDSGHGRYDYAYLIHEIKGDSFRGRVSGTIGRFLDVPAEQNYKKWLKQIENDIKAKARGQGF